MFLYTSLLKCSSCYWLFLFFFDCFMFVFPNRLWAPCYLEWSLSCPLQYPYYQLQQNHPGHFKEGISKREFETGSWLHRKYTEMRSWMLLPWGLEGRRRRMVSPESEAEAVPWLVLARTLEGRAGWWGTGTTMGKWCSKQRETVSKKNLASPYFSISTLLLVPPIGHSYWKIVGKDKQETVFKRRMRKKLESKEAMTDAAWTNEYL